MHVWKNVLAFFLMGLKFCTIIELFIPTNEMFYYHYFNSFWRESDFTVLKANVHFPVMAQEEHDSKKIH